MVCLCSGVIVLSVLLFPRLLFILLPCTLFLLSGRPKICPISCDVVPPAPGCASVGVPSKVEFLLDICTVPVYVFPTLAAFGFFDFIQFVCSTFSFT